MSESIILTEQELAILTGCKQKKTQILWLEENNIHHFVNKLGKPIVIRKTFTARYEPMAISEPEPNFGALTNGT